jgi:hypothetical protein
LHAVIRLGHAPHEFPGHVHEHVGGQVQVGVLQVAGDPTGKLVPFVVPLVTLVCKYLQQREFSAMSPNFRFSCGSVSRHWSLRKGFGAFWAYKYVWKVLGRQLSSQGLAAN